VDLVDEVLRRLQADSDIASVIAAAQVTDTIKEANVSRRVLRTPERNRLWAVQTPQAFRAEGLRDAVAAHPDDLGTVTDDAQLIEREGGEVLIHEAPASNLKITTPLDLRVAEILLAEREAG
jgi:2-C-methyl-D-erythritol 4-phosphate cytidylyltransferase